MEIKKDRLVGVKFVESPNHSGEIKPDTIVIHYTAGRDAPSSVKTLIDPTSEASAHLVVGRDGSITQLVPFNVKAWHAGRSSFKGRSGFNSFSVGIEIDNAGWLTKSGNIFKSWFERVYEQGDVFESMHRNFGKFPQNRETNLTFWHRYNEEQISLVHELCGVLVKAYGINLIVGHEEISPERKVDPGPAFPLDKLRNAVLGGGRKEDGEERLKFPLDGVVAATKLNIREAPDIQASRIAKPLPHGTRLKILEKSKNWYRVTTEIEGWMSSEHIEPSDT